MQISRDESRNSPQRSSPRLRTNPCSESEEIAQISRSIVVLLKQSKEQQHDPTVAAQQVFQKLLSLLKKYRISALLVFKSLIVLVLKHWGDTENRKLFQLRSSLKNAVLQIQPQGYIKELRETPNLYPLQIMNRKEAPWAVKSCPLTSEPKTDYQIQELIHEILKLSSQNFMIQDSNLKRVVQEKQQSSQLNFVYKRALDIVSTVITETQNINSMLSQKYYMKGAEVQESQGVQTEFKSYTFPMLDKKLIQVIKKTIVSFLNKSGGTMYIGIKELGNRKRIVEGVKCDQEVRKEVQRFFDQDVLCHILPQIHYEILRPGCSPLFSFSSCSGKGVKQKRQDKKQPVTISVKVEFRPVISYKEKLIDMWVVLVRVKQGNPQRLYHFIEGQNAEFYIRSGVQSVKFKNMQEVHEEIHRRITKT